MTKMIKSMVRRRSKKKMRLSLEVVAVPHNWSNSTTMPLKKIRTKKLPERTPSGLKNLKLQI